MTDTSLDTNVHPLELPKGVSVHGCCSADHARILTVDALGFVAEIQRRFGPERQRRLAARTALQSRLDAGERLGFLVETEAVRTTDWRVGAIPADLRDRTVEITGPVDRKMIINALNSGANVFMADFEDSTSPTFENILDGQVNLRDAVRRQIDYVHPQTGKTYCLDDRTATLMVRPRGWHLVEKNVTVDGEPVSAALFDFALFLFHNAYALIERGSGPYFYLPKLENFLEARLWNEIFEYAQHALDIPSGTIKATVLIETITAAFQMDEILHELRDHSIGLNCGRWDYIFSFIKRSRNQRGFVLPDRGIVGMDQPFMRAYSQLLIKTCHRRGAHAMGGMAAQIPIKDDEARNARAMARVRQDKEREAKDGHDGTWVAHPGLVEIAREQFAAVRPAAERLEIKRDDVSVEADDLLAVPKGSISEVGLRQNLRVGVLYLESWLGGKGCVPIDDLMEDAATAEISRTQIWQWIRHRARLDDGRLIDVRLFRRMLAEETDKIRRTVGEDRYAAGRFELASGLFERLIARDDLPEFLTLAAYDHI